MTDEFGITTTAKELRESAAVIAARNLDALKLAAWLAVDLHNGCEASHEVRKFARLWLRKPSVPMRKVVSAMRLRANQIEEQTGRGSDER